MKNFCLYSGTKILKLETWNITSIELSSDYTSAIIQGESKFNRSQYTLDITPLVANQYKNGIDPYSATVVNQLTGADDWVLDTVNNQILYTPNKDADKTADPNYQYQCGDNNTIVNTKYECGQIALADHLKLPAGSQYLESVGSCFGTTTIVCSFKRKGENTYTNSSVGVRVPRVDPYEEEDKKTLPLETVAQQVISNANTGDTPAQNYIVSIFNNITDILLSNNHSDLFEQNKKPK